MHAICVGGSASSTKSLAPSVSYNYRKTKCDGVQPTCGSCIASGRQGEVLLLSKIAPSISNCYQCSWTAGEPVRVPRTEAHFEALRKRIEILQDQVNTLQELVDKCNAQHGGHGSAGSLAYQHSRGHTSNPDPPPLAVTSTEEEDVASSMTNLKVRLVLQHLQR